MHLLSDHALVQHQRSEAAAANKVVAVLVALAVFACILAILRTRGPRVCLAACGYVVSLVAIALTMRELSRPPLRYKFPGFVTFVHYTFTWIACAAYWAIMREPWRCLPSSVGSMRRYLQRMIPIALALPVSIALNNRALIFIGAGLCSIVGTLSPVCTAVLSRACGRRLSAQSWLGVAVAFGGALLIGAFEVRSALALHHVDQKLSMLWGLLFALLALGLRSTRVVLQDTLTSPSAYAGGLAADKELPLTALHLLAAQSPPVVLVSLVFAFATESLPRACSQLTKPVVGMVVLTAVIATTLNILGASLLKDMGSTALQIIGKLNSIVTVAISMAFFGERLPGTVLAGTAIVLLGVAVFESGGHAGKPEKLAGSDAIGKGLEKA